MRPSPQRASARSTAPDFSLNFMENGCRTAWGAGLEMRIARALRYQGTKTGFFQLFDALLERVDEGREATPFAGIHDHADHVAVATQSDSMILLQDTTERLLFSELTYGDLGTQRDRIFAAHICTIALPT